MSTVSLKPKVSRLSVLSIEHKEGVEGVEEDGDAEDGKIDSGNGLFLYNDAETFGATVTKNKFIR